MAEGGPATISDVSDEEFILRIAFAHAAIQRMRETRPGTIAWPPELDQKVAIFAASLMVTAALDEHNAHLSQQAHEPPKMPKMSSDTARSYA